MCFKWRISSSLYISVSITLNLIQIISILSFANVFIIKCMKQFRSHKASLTPPLRIEVPVPSQESQPSCIHVLGLSVLSHSTDI